jgi:citronellol/citronellal dehydrogenase
MKRYDLMHEVNVRGTFLCTQKCVPHLARAANPHVLMISPPLDMSARWFAPHVAYTIAKYGMSLCVLGMAEEFRGAGIAVNALWPRTTIATSAVKNLLGGDALMRASRTPDILADAAYAIFHKPKTFSGNFLLDDTFLAGEGVTDFDKYRAVPGAPLAGTFFVPDGEPLPPPGVVISGNRWE